jgi:hypothetical protein
MLIRGAFKVPLVAELDYVTAIDGMTRLHDSTLTHVTFCNDELCAGKL